MKKAGRSPEVIYYDVTNFCFETERPDEDILETMEPLEIISKYHGLTQIEDQFRVMKSGLETRPVFVRSKEHIEAHLLICMISLIMMRLIQKRILSSGLIENECDAYWSMGLNARRIQKALNKWKVDLLPGELYRFMDVDDPDLITVIFCYRNLGKPLKMLMFSWVSCPSYLVSCYIVLPLVMTSNKGKNKGKKIR